MTDMLVGRRGFILLAPVATGARGASPNPNYSAIVTRSGPTFPRGP